MRQNQQGNHEGGDLKIPKDQFGPIASAVLSAAVTLGVIYATFGGNIERNTTDIIRLERLLGDISDIKTEQATATAERASMLKTLDRMLGKMGGTTISGKKTTAGI